MSGWGSSGWGTPGWGQPGVLPSIMLTRLLRFVQLGPRFRSYEQAVANRTEALIAAATQINNAFDVTKAVGVQLDVLGAILQRPRLGADDARYRVLLQIQIDLILSSTAGAETLLSVFSRLTGSMAAEYAEHYPAQFTIGGYVPPADVTLLTELLRLAKGWGIYSGLSVHPDPDETLLADVSDNAGLWSSVVSDMIFHPAMIDLVDVPSAQTGTADGTTYDATFDAREFNGLTDRLDFTGIELAGSALTFAGWVNFTALAHESRLWSSRLSAGSGSSFISVSVAGAVRLFRATDTVSMQRISNAAVIATGGWHHVAVTHDASLTAANATIYVDGLEVAGYLTTTNGTGTEQSTAFGWHIGGRFINDTVNVDGSMTDFRSWDRELSAAAINHLYEKALAAGAGVFAGPPTAAPLVDDPGVADVITGGPLALAYATEATVTV